MNIVFPTPASPRPVQRRKYHAFVERMKRALRRKKAAAVPPPPPPSASLIQLSFPINIPLPSLAPWQINIFLSGGILLLVVIAFGLYQVGRILSILERIVFNIDHGLALIFGFLKWVISQK
ncbi:hypothetical protein BX666DRAFT_1995913 [Dichotomocladium elegans]|nr:hypothetical protein BX666DRAFT_1995913 [Dichotomocladium elegans]